MSFNASTKLMKNKFIEMKKLKDTKNEKSLEQLLEQKKNEAEALQKLLDALDSNKTKNTIKDKII